MKSPIDRRHFFATAAGLFPPISGPPIVWGQEPRPTFKVKVDMVVLSFTVTDSKGHYVNGLKPSDFRIYEDSITQKDATFPEGNKPALQILEDGTTRPVLAVEKSGDQGPMAEVR